MHFMLLIEKNMRGQIIIKIQILILEQLLKNLEILMKIRVGMKIIIKKLFLDILIGNLILQSIIKILYIQMEVLEI